MGKPKKKRTSDVYRTDVQRLSVYPSYNYSKNRQKDKELGPEKNSVITVRVTQIDDNGHPLAIYRGYKVILLGEANPGDRVEVLVKDVKGSNIIGAIISREEASYNL